MAYIETIPRRRATGPTAEAYRQLGQLLGRAQSPHVIELFSLHPRTMITFVREWELTHWLARSPRTSTELVAATVSRLNECTYCHGRPRGLPAGRRG